jgi:hypothetical protein
MPETAMNEDRQLPWSEHDIGPAGQLTRVQAIPEAETVQDSADGHLGASILGPDRRHDPASLRWRARVRHAATLPFARAHGYGAAMNEDDDDENAKVLHEGPGYRIALRPRAATLVPYFRAERQSGDVNHGFFDLRDNPDGVDGIPEAAKLPGLAAFLRAIAEHPRIMSSACEAGVFDRGAEHDGPRFQGGSFVIIEYRDVEKARDVDRYENMAGYILSKIPPTDEHHVSFDMLIEPLRTFFGHDGCYALNAKGIGFGDSETAAWIALDHAMAAMAQAIRASIEEG